jgi:hypothetical protein
VIEGRKQPVRTGFPAYPGHPGELQEPDCDLAVLAVAAPRGEMLEDELGQQPLDVIVESGRHRVGRRAVRGPRQQDAVPLGSPAAGFGQLGGGAWAEQDLARLRRRLEPGGDRRRAAGDQQLAVDRTEEGEVEPAGVDADGHSQPHPAHRGVQHTDPAHRGPHGCRGRARATHVVGAVVHHEQGVATPLHQPPAVCVGRFEQLAQDQVEVVGHLLGAEAALGREPLGQPGEPGDVREHQRAVQAPGGRCRVVPGPVASQLGDERAQHE